MSGSAHTMAHQLRMQGIAEREAKDLGRLVDVLEYQAESSRRSQRAAWMISVLSLIVACGSLACTIITLL